MGISRTSLFLLSIFAALSVTKDAQSPLLQFSDVAEREINAEFEKAVQRVFDKNGDTPKFDCLRIMPYETANPKECPYDSLFAYDFPHEGLLYFNGKDDTPNNSEGGKLKRITQNLFFPKEWYAINQLGITGHEFQHYLDYKQEQPSLNKPETMRSYGPGEEIERRVTLTLRESELKGDLYRIAVVRSYHPDKAVEYAVRLQGYRAEELRLTHRDGHSGITEFNLHGLAKAATPKDPEALGRYVNLLYAQSRISNTINFN